MTGAPAPPLIEARKLTKHFEDRAVVGGVDFRVYPGEFFGFLGANGAGKTTTMRMIATISPHSGGELRVLGLDAARHGRRIRERLGVVHQDDNLDSELTVIDNLRVYGRYFGLSRHHIRARSEELLEFARLSDRRTDQVENLSGGMRRRLAIARALVNRPALVLLDEPTTGLDPYARYLLWERLHQLKQAGVSLVLTTHYMDEAEQLCDRLAIMDRGQIVETGTPQDLVAKYTAAQVIEARFPDHHLGVKALHSLPGVERIGRTTMVADRIFVYPEPEQQRAAELAVAACRPATVLVRPGSLEDVFLWTTGKAVQE